LISESTFIDCNIREVKPISAKYYAILPLLPFGKNKITRIASISPVTYGFLRSLLNELPKGVDADLDYMDNELVVPVIVYVDQNPYRVPETLWMVLCDIAQAIQLKQYKTHSKIFPIKVDVDDFQTSKKWIPTLMNIVKQEFLFISRSRRI
jgi:hypothetical protein